jgi:stage II sporulation protein AB (anti-sigma F factor)
MLTELNREGKQMQKSDEMRLEISAASENESFARAVVGAFMTRINPTLEEIADVKTAVSEAVTNCIVHGYKNNSQGRITISSQVTQDMFVVEIKDLGCGIQDIQQAMEPFYTSQPEMERSGMGFTVMKEFMDEVTVESSVGMGTTVRMTKRFAREK